MHEKAKKAVGGVINIEDNVIIYKDTVICADNISTINLSKAPGTSYRISLGLLIAGIYLIVSGGLNIFTLVFGIISLVACLVAFIIILVLNQSRPMALIISTNDSNYFYFTSQDVRFLNDAMNAAVDCIAEGRRGKVSINLENSTVTNSAIGNNSTYTRN